MLTYVNSDAEYNITRAEDKAETLGEQLKRAMEDNRGLADELRKLRGGTEKRTEGAGFSVKEKVRVIKNVLKQ